MDRETKERFFEEQRRARAAVIRGPHETHEYLGRGRYAARIRRNLNYAPDPVGAPTDWREPDTTLEAGAGGTLKCDSITAPCELPGRANGAFIQKDRVRGNAVLEFKYRGASPQSRRELVDASTVLYRDVYDDVDLRVTVTNSGLKFEWILTGPTHPAELDVEVKGTAGLDFEIRDGALVFDDRQNARRALSLSPVVMTVPQEDDPRMCEVSSPSNGIFRWTFPDLAGTVYPVTFDPTTTFNPDADPETTTVDGYAQQSSSNITFAALTAAAGNGANDSALFLRTQINSGTVSNRFNILLRIYLVFDTSSIPDAASIVSAFLTLTGDGVQATNLGDLEVGVYNLASALASDTSLFAGDYDVIGSTRLDSSGHVISDIGTNALDFVLNANGLAEIDPTGKTYLAVTLTNDVDGVAPTWSSSTVSRASFDSSDAGADGPELSVTYSTAVEIDVGTVTRARTLPAATIAFGANIAVGTHTRARTLPAATIATSANVSVGTVARTRTLPGATIDFGFDIPVATHTRTRTLPQATILTPQVLALRASVTPALAVGAADAEAALAMRAASEAALTITPVEA